jgi:hypothetical protein
MLIRCRDRFPACAGEYFADHKLKWLTSERKEHLQRRSTILLIAALSASLVCVIRTNELSGNVIGSLGDKAVEADGKAQKAISDSSTALTQSEGAVTTAGGAKTKADVAKTVAGEAQDKAVAVAKQAEQLQADLKKSSAELNEYIDEVATRVKPRGLDGKIFSDALKGKPNDARVVLWYNPNDFESYTFAMEIWQLLGPWSKATGGFDGAGWNVSFPQPIPDVKLPPHERGSSVVSISIQNGQTVDTGQQFVMQMPFPYSPTAPVTAQFEGSGADGLTILSKHPAGKVGPGITGLADNPPNALTWAIVKSTGLTVINQSWPDLDPNVIIVVITAQNKEIIKQTK